MQEDGNTQKYCSQQPVAYEKKCLHVKIFQPPLPSKKNKGPSVISSVLIWTNKFYLSIGLILHDGQNNGEEEPVTQSARSRRSYGKIGDCKRSSFAASPLNKSVVTMEAWLCVNKRLEDADTQSFPR